MARFVIEDDSTPPRTIGRFAIEEDKPKEQFGERLNREIGMIPRQVGLTARHALQGVGGLLDFAASPFRGALNAVLPDDMQIQPGGGKFLADKAGLPTPQNATERVVGSAAEMMAGSMVPLGVASRMEPLYNVSRTAAVKTADDAARLAQSLPTMARPVLKSMAANPGSQIASAGASGLAGQYVKETGGDDTSQLVASLAAGIGTPFAIAGAQKSMGAAKSLATSKLPPSQPMQAQIDITINEALKPSGLTLDALPANVRTSMRTDVRKAMSMEGDLSPEAIRRLADYRLTGATPRRSTVTLDPVQVTQERNLAKAGANSKDVAAQELARAENSNNRQLIQNLNQLGADTADDAFAGGQKVIGALKDRLDSAKSLIGQRYEAARAANGRSALLDPSDFTNKANDALDQALLGGKLPADVRSLLNKAATGDMPLTVDVAEQFKTRIGELQRATMDPAERKALGLVRRALDDTALLNGQGQEAIDAFSKARRLNRAWEGIVEKTPALQAVREGVEPDKFVQTFIIGNGSKTNTADLAALRRSLKGNPEAMTAVKTQITSYLKNQALGGAADEVGNFSQSAYNKALRSIGDRKLSMFFSPDEIALLKANGRVASYEQFQPRGSAVNNSNTSGALVGVLDRVANSPLLSKIPFGNQLAMPAERISVGVQAKQALDIPRGLLGNPILSANQQPVGLLMSPAAFMQPQDRESKGLLFAP